MPIIRATASAVIDAPPEVAYAVIADYRNGHPHILPRKYFTGLDVERGGTGAGTVIRFGMTAFGRTQTMRAEVLEPEPGRVLVERELGGDRGLTTTFTVEPLEEGRRCKVTFLTEWTSPGLKGLFERWMAPGFLRRVYVDELKLLNDVASERARAAVGA